MKLLFNSLGICRQHRRRWLTYPQLCLSLHLPIELLLNEINMWHKSSIYCYDLGTCRCPTNALFFPHNESTLSNVDFYAFVNRFNETYPEQQSLLNCIIVHVLRENHFAVMSTTWFPFGWICNLIFNKKEREIHTSIH